MGSQYYKEISVAVLAAAALAAHRFVAYDGNYATSAGGAKDSRGINEYDAPAGSAASVIVDYSGLAEAAETINAFDFVKPAADGSGKAAVGTATDHCGRALAAASAGQLVEVEVLPHRHT